MNDIPAGERWAGRREACLVFCEVAAIKRLADGDANAE